MVPSSGRWPHDGFPEEIEHEGRPFRRARWHEERPGIVAQYREAVATWSAHLQVRDDGTWFIDHRDKVNPDMGSILLHGVLDTARGQAALRLVGAAARVVRRLAGSAKAVVARRG